jgi:hypothetical protein
MFAVVQFARSRLCFYDADLRMKIGYSRKSAKRNWMLHTARGRWFDTSIAHFVAEFCGGVPAQSARVTQAKSKRG